jgi:isocitrate/isopropylmalate dehydrogenase
VEDFGSKGDINSKISRIDFYRKSSDGLFLEVSREVAKEYPDIEHNDMIIDNCCMQLVSKPHQFDVMLMTNLYGTIVSNLICGLIGGAGLLSGRNYGYDVSCPSITNMYIPV